jgi:lysine-N-methylase
MPILHRTQSISALMPRFVERFRCIGASCEDTCCSGWTVHVDKKTYKAYRKDAGPGLDRMMANMKRLEDGAANGAYAEIRAVGELQQCPALQDGICSVQANLGESYLSDVCHVYPRTNLSMDGMAEQSITLSCPEAARLALLAEDAFEFVEAPVQVRKTAVREVGARFGMAPALVAEARLFCLNLLRTRELALWQRLALLGIFCESLSELCARDAQTDLPVLVQDFMRLVESGELTTTLDMIQPDYGAQAMVFATLWATKGFKADSPREQVLLDQIAARFGADANGQVSAEGLVNAYRRGLARMEAALESTPWLLEHYLLNEVFSQIIPFNGSTPYDSYVQLMARFGLLRLVLAVQCNNDGDVPPVDTLISTVQLHCRRFQHVPSYTKRVNDSLHESGWAELSKLYTLLKT